MNGYLKIFFIISLLFFFSTTSIHSQVNVDSLLLVADAAKGENKLEIYKQLATNSLANSSSLVEIEQLEVEAKQQSNSLYLSYAYLYKSGILGTQNIRDSIPFYMTYAITEFEKHGKWLALRLAYEQQIGNYIMGGKYELALYYTKRLLDKGVALNDLSYQSAAYKAMGMTYITSRRDEKALEALEKSLELRNQYAPEKENAEDLIPYYAMMSSSAIKNKQYERAEQYAKRIEEILQQEGLKESKYLDYFHYFSKLVYAQLYTDIEDFEKGKKFLDDIASDPEFLNSLPESILGIKNK